MKQWKWNTFRPVPIIIYLLLFLLDILLYAAYQSRILGLLAVAMAICPFALFVLFSIVMICRRKGQRQGIFRPVRIFSYLVLFLLDILLYKILQSYFLLVIAVIMAVFPFFSIWGMNRLCHVLQFMVSIGQDTTVCDDEVCLEIHISNPFWYAALDSRILLRVANVFYETSSEITVSMPVRMRGESVLRLPVQVKDVGRFRIECLRLVIQDMLGMICYPVKVSGDCEFCVYPRGKKGDDIEITGFLAGAVESEESHSKGSDFSEVSDIREYIPGDRIRDIHWKLSAKQDILMVKERIAMAGTEMVILLQFSSSKEQSQEIVETAYGLGRTLIRSQLPVRLLCWNQRLYEFDEFCCGTETELLEAFGDIFQTSLFQRLSEEQLIYMKNCYPYLGSYLVVARKDGEVQVVMRENV